MDAGQFDRRVTLQRATVADDGYSTEVTGYTNLATVWAKYIPISGAEMFAAGEVSSFNRIRLKIRRDSSWSDLNATDRLFLGDDEGKPHNILSVRSEGRGFYLIDAVLRGDDS